MTADGGGAAPPSEPFAAGDLAGEVATRYRPRDPEALSRLVDPASAEATVHWGRNYLYRARLATTAGDLDVVVKQFRPGGLRERLRGGVSKAAKSWRMARLFAALGLPTAEAVALVEPADGAGASYFVTRDLGPVVEARYLLRARNAGRLADEFPDVDFPAFLDAVGRAARRMHDAGVVHRDLSIGNVLLTTAGPERGRVVFVDLNRARRVGRPGTVRRSRDLCRLALFRPGDRRRLLAAYHGGRPGALFTALYLAFHHGFRAKVAAKDRWRRVERRLRDWVVPRGVHPHIPAAPAAAAQRDRVVWDALSDQPHHHAGRLAKLGIRAADAPSHLRQAAAVAAAAPRIWRRYRALEGRLFAEPAVCDGVGVGLRPLPQAPGELLAAVVDLGVRHVLVRLHPWEGRYDAEEELARELHARGRELVFAVPQNRDLVRDPERWRGELEAIAERFLPFGRAFQVGQAINRSKWGAWTYGEYLELAGIAAEVLRRRDPGVVVAGPAVIDFELQATAAVVNAPGGVGFDVLASLLYVDRRGAPEARQLGFDTPRKLALLRAIAETARHCGPRSWVTEVNWPLWEGPHSPAGRSVSIDEPTQAVFLARYYLLALASGMCERVYWWQLAARGYGLATLDGPRLRRRPSFAALATLERQVGGARYEGRLPSPPGTWLLRFTRDDGDVLAGWSTHLPTPVTLPAPPTRIVTLTGDDHPPTGPRVTLRPEVQYYRLAPG